MGEGGEAVVSPAVGHGGNAEANDVDVQGSGLLTQGLLHDCIHTSVTADQEACGVFGAAGMNGGRHSKGVDWASRSREELVRQRFLPVTVLTVGGKRVAIMDWRSALVSVSGGKVNGDLGAKPLILQKLKN